MGIEDSDTGIKIYLREIGQIPLLTPQDEITLAARIKKGDKEARSLMIRSNLRLVVKIAHDYANLGLPLLDLISEGNIGLMKAVERFDPAKGGKLSTYAAWWIKQSIKRALANQSKTIRLPVHLVDKISKMRRVSLQMSEELGREPSDDELAEEIGIAAGKVSQLKTVSIRPASLDAPISDEDSTEFGEIVGDEDAFTPFELLRDKNLRNEVDGLLDVLDDRERKIIFSRFGLDGGKPKTLEEVGKKFGVTRERIRQLQNIALSKLRRALQKKERPVALQPEYRSASFPIFGPRAARFRNAHLDDAQVRPDRKIGDLSRPVFCQPLTEIIVDLLRQHLGGRVLAFKRDDPLAVGCLQIGESGIVRAHAHRVIVLIQERLHRFLDHLEIADHVAGVEGVCLEHELHGARMAVREAAFIGMLGEHVAVLDLERFADAKRHGSGPAFIPEKVDVQPVAITISQPQTRVDEGLVAAAQGGEVDALRHHQDLRRGNRPVDGG
jgi:RNA polymerase primary sigma factor